MNQIRPEDVPAPVNSEGFPQDTEDSDGPTDFEEQLKERKLQH